MKLIIPVLVLLLAGCVTSEERAHNYCQGIGLQYGTQGYANCRMEITRSRYQAAQRRQAERAATNRAIMQRMKQTNCTSHVIGNRLYTNCN